MQRVINVAVGNTVTHNKFGNGVVKSINKAKFSVQIDFESKKDFNATLVVSKGVMSVGGNELSFIDYLGANGSYLIDFEYFVASFDKPAPLHKSTATFGNVTEKDAAKQCEERATAYLNYAGGFYITKIEAV